MYTHVVWFVYSMLWNVYVLCVSSACMWFLYSVTKCIFMCVFLLYRVYALCGCGCVWFVYNIVKYVSEVLPCAVYACMCLCVKYVHLWVTYVKCVQVVSGVDSCVAHVHGVCVGEWMSRASKRDMLGSGCTLSPRSRRGRRHRPSGPPSQHCVCQRCCLPLNVLSQPHLPSCPSKLGSLQCTLPAISLVTPAAGSWQPPPDRASGSRAVIFIFLV